MILSDGAKYVGECTDGKPNGEGTCSISETLSNIPDIQQLWPCLLELRREIADEQNKEPYLLFHKNTLIDMAKKQPQTIKGLKCVAGVGAAKLNQYGERFLLVLKQHKNGNH